MARGDIVKLVEELVNPVLRENNCELIDVEYKKEGPNWYLRVYIDKPGGVTLDDCQAVSEYLSEELDRMDPIEHSYILEVSSPGVNRPLKTDRDYERFRGREVDVKLYAPLDGKKELSGRLLGLEEGIVSLQIGEKVVNIPKEKIASARLAFKF